MTSKTSLVKRHPVSSFFIFTLKKQMPLTLLVTAFTLLICPGMLLRDANDDLVRQYTIDPMDFSMFAFIIMAASSLLVFMLLLLNFGFLFSKKAGDMYHALPLTRNEILFTRTISSFIGGLFTMTLSYVCLAIVNSLPTVDGVSTVTVIKTYLFMLLCLPVITLFCLLFVVCSGGYFDTVIAIGAISLAPILIVAILFLVAEESTTGLVMNYGLLVYASPIAFMFYKLLLLPQNLESTEPSVAWLDNISLITVIGIIVFGVVCAYIAARLFKVRRSETAGEAYSFKLVPVIISLLVSMVGGYVIAGILTGFNTDFNPIFWVFFIVCDILCAIAIGAITTRGFKKVKASVISGSIAAVVMIALVIGSMFVADYAENKIPKAGSIEKIYIGYGGDVVFEKDFDLVLDLHKGVLDSINNENSQDVSNTYPEVVSNFNGLDFHYVMKSGTRIDREYWYKSPDMSTVHPQLLKIMQHDSFLAKFDGCTREPYGSFIHITSFATKFGEMEDDGSVKSAMITSAEAKKFIDCFKSEMKAADLDIFKEDTYGVSISGENYNDIYIPVSFEKTISYLTELFEKSALHFLQTNS